MARLWSEWLTSLDHKKIGIMYVVLAFVMLSRALIEAVLMRMQQAAAIDTRLHCPRRFRAIVQHAWQHHDLLHGDAVFAGLINYVMPLQIGAATFPFP